MLPPAITPYHTMMGNTIYIAFIRDENASNSHTLSNSIVVFCIALLKIVNKCMENSDIVLVNISTVQIALNCLVADGINTQSI